MTTVYRHELEVAHGDLDQNDHVNNVVYVRWMQEAAVGHAEAVGGALATRSAGASWVVRSHRIEYLKPALLGDRVAVLTWVANFRKATSLRKFKFERPSDGAVLARGESEYVFVDAGSGRPRVIPQEVSGAFEIVLADDEP